MNNPHRYAPDWHDTIRPAILKRDKFKCTFCGAKQRATGYYNQNDVFIECDDFMIAWAKQQGLKVVKIHLQVMHLDQNPSNNDFANLRTGCPRHHFKFDAAFNKAKRIMPKGKP